MKNEKGESEKNRQGRHANGGGVGQPYASFFGTAVRMYKQ